MGACKLTKSVNEHKGHSPSVKDSTLAGCIKYLRRAYLVSLIVFMTNSECHSPFHARDVVMWGFYWVDSHLNRFAIKFAPQWIRLSILSTLYHMTGRALVLVDKAFTVVSTDNVDFLQSNAAMNSGDQHHS